MPLSKFSTVNNHSLNQSEVFCHTKHFSKDLSTNRFPSQRVNRKWIENESYNWIPIPTKIGEKKTFPQAIGKQNITMFSPAVLAMLAKHQGASHAAYRSCTVDVWGPHTHYSSITQSLDKKYCPVTKPHFLKYRALWSNLTLYNKQGLPYKIYRYFGDKNLCCHHQPRHVL